MAAPGSIAQYAKLIDPAVRQLFVDTYAKEKAKLDYVFQVEMAEDYNQQHSRYTGLGSLTPVAEGATIPQDAPLQAYTTTFTQTKYAKAPSITYETKLWEKDNLSKQMASMAAKAAARHSEKIGAAVFNNGFSTSYTSYGDGKPLFSTDHTRTDGATAQSNASATGLTLTETNVETLQIQLEELLDDRGEIISTYADCILVPLALRKEATIITKSELRSGTGDNDMNTYNGLSKYEGGIADVVAWKNLGAAAGGSDTAWFMLSSDHAIRFLWGEKPVIEMDESIGFLNDVIQWKVRYFAATGWDDFRGAVGSKGDGAAYSS